MLKNLLFAFLALFKVNNGEFWTGIVNAIMQVVLRFLPGELAENVGKPIADILLYLLPYAVGRFISKAAKGPSGV